MRIPETWTNTYEFACSAKACAPPPAGKGGSLPGGGKKPSSQYEIMKAREARQAALAQTNRARANYGMKPISN